VSCEISTAGSATVRLSGRGLGKPCGLVDLAAVDVVEAVAVAGSHGRKDGNMFVEDEAVADIGREAALVGERLGTQLVDAQEQHGDFNR
jgi:hypothetical protein